MCGCCLAHGLKLKAGQSLSQVFVYEVELTRKGVIVSGATISHRTTDIMFFEPFVDQP